MVPRLSSALRAPPLCRYTIHPNVVDLQLVWHARHLNTHNPYNVADSQTA